MRLLTRYVLFFCDDCNLLTPAIEAFQSINKYYTVITSSDEGEFLSKIEQYSPEMLLVYLHNPSKEYVSLMRTIRETPKFSSIPLLVYKKLPAANDLIQSFRTMIGFEDED